MKIGSFENTLSSITLSELPYPDNLIQHYQALNSLPGFVLLDSSDIKRGRFDIVTAYPYDRFQVANNVTDPSAIYSQFKNKLPTTDSCSDLPFQGGAIGFFSYDFGAQVVGIRSNPHPVISDMPLVDMYLYDWAIIADHQKRAVWLVVGNQSSNTKSIIEEILYLWKNPSSQSNSFSLSKPFSPVISTEEYKLSFDKIHSDLRAGRAYQVNYTQPFVAEFLGNTWDIYKRIRQKNPVPFSAFLRFDHSDVLSFSPERFVLMNQKNLLTSPIKGSIKRSSIPEEDKSLQSNLLSSNKNRAENVMIVDLLRNDLGKIAVPGSVKVKSLCELQSFAAVHHLVSDIEAKAVEKMHMVDVFNACFPGGSITGTPKREAIHIIDELETYSRGIYCGSIGYFSNHGRFDTNIAIRTITARNKHLYLAAGGALVVDSTWDDEYKECYTKIAAIVNQFE